MSNGGNGAVNIRQPLGTGPGSSNPVTGPNCTVDMGQAWYSESGDTGRLVIPITAFNSAFAGNKSVFLMPMDRAGQVPADPYAAGQWVVPANYTAVQPSISSFSPATGSVGTAVTIQGQNFGVVQSTSTVTFNGISAAIQSWTPTKIIANVPSGNAGGYVRVNVGSLSAQSSTQFGGAAMSTPIPGSTLTDNVVQFNWTGGGGSQYLLSVGSTGVGSSNIFSQNVGSNLSTIVNNIPSGGVPIYVRLWTFLASGWVFVDYTYTAVQASPTGTITATPSSLNEFPGSTATYQLTITPPSGLTSNLTLSTTGVFPAGVNASFDNASVSGSGTSTRILTITTSGSSPGGTYPFTVLAKAGRSKRSEESASGDRWGESSVHADRIAFFSPPATPASARCPSRYRRNRLWRDC